MPIVWRREAGSGRQFNAGQAQAFRGLTARDNRPGSYARAKKRVKTTLAAGRP
jgi:hypothetical protein